MKKINFSKIIIIALILIIASFSAISITANSYKKGANPNDFSKVVNDGVGVIDSLIGAPGRFFETRLTEFENVMNAYKQNATLKEQLTSLTNQNQQLSSLQEENKQLKAALDLQATLTNFTTSNANVITRTPATWSQLLVIDKGSDAGLKVNMLIMANGGVVGRITQVNAATSKVELLSNTANLVNKIPVKFGNVYGLLSSYDSSTGNYVITNLTSTADITTGSNVSTSGLGGDAPADLLLGTIVSVSGKSSDINRQVYVKPAAQFDDIRFVTVVLRAVSN